MSNFYRAVEGKTWRGLPVYKFTGKREAMIDRGEFDFDHCEFVCTQVAYGDFIQDCVVITPESLPRLKHIIWSWPNTAFRYIWEWLIDTHKDDERLIEIDGVLVPASGVQISAEELELEHYEWHTDNPTLGLYLDWPEFAAPIDFYEAVEGKTHLGLPVYKFTGEMRGAVSNQECNFDGCEFVALRDRFTDDRLIVICHEREGWAGAMTFYAGDLDPCHDPYGTFELDWPEFGKPADV